MGPRACAQAVLHPSRSTADNNPPIRGLPGLLAAAIGRDIEEVYAGNNKNVLADVDLLQQITGEGTGLQRSRSAEEGLPLECCVAAVCCACIAAWHCCCCMQAGAAH